VVGKGEGERGEQRGEVRCRLAIDELRLGRALKGWDGMKKACCKEETRRKRSTEATGTTEGGETRS
jgi:hypothetical protein